MSTVRRIARLEQHHRQSQQPGHLGIRIFEQSPTDAALFRPVVGPAEDWQAHTTAEVDALQAAGWQCIRVMRPAASVDLMEGA